MPEARGEEPPVSSASAHRRAPGSEAVREILAPLAFGEAPRIGCLGDPGGGKTEAARAVALEYTRQATGLVVVLDAKGERRFDDLPLDPPPIVRVSPADLAGRPGPPGTRVVVARAPLTEDIDPEAWARFVVGLAEGRWGSLTIHDELAQASAGASWRRGSVFLPRTFVRGRSQGLGVLWCTTSPQDVPVVAFEVSDTILQFKTSGMAIDLLDRRKYLRGIEPETIEALAGYPLPPSERGEFVLLRRGQPWNGIVYKF